MLGNINVLYWNFGYDEFGCGRVKRIALEAQRNHADVQHVGLFVFRGIVFNSVS